MAKQLTQEEVESRISKKFNNTVIVKSQYKGKRYSIQLQCLICNYEWETIAANAMTTKYDGECFNCKTKKEITEKICRLCNSVFVLNGKRGGQNREFCYTCLPDNMSRYERSKYKRLLLTKITREHKELQGCFICGYNKCGAALDWHHIDVETKEESLSVLLYRSFESYLQESEKCRVLCANCHRELHYYISLMD